MGYQGTDGLYTVFPPASRTTGSGRSAPGRKRSSSGGGSRPAPYGRTAAGAIRSKPCAHGPSPARGNCPKKARTSRGQAVQTIRAVTRAAGAPKGGAVETVLTAAGGAAAGSAARAVRGARGAALAEAAIARLGPKAVAVIGTTGIGLVGLASYFITKRFLEGRRQRREDRAAEAHRLSQVYRQTRAAAEELAGGRLDPIQHAILADAFQTALADAGVDHRNLKGL